MRSLLYNSQLRAATLVLLLFFSCRGWVAAQSTNSSPQIKCISVDSIGDVTLTWITPANLNANFTNYQVYYSNKYGGPYVPAAASVAIPAQTSQTIPGLPANNFSFYFYIVTDTTGGGNSPAFDTLSSINLIAVSSNGLAQLRWNPIYPPSGLPTSTGWYKIYKEYPQYVWTLIDSTKNLDYTDTITTCGAWINYRVEIADTSAGCISSSNWAGTNFSALIPSAPVMDTVSVSGNSINITWSKSRRNDVIGYVLYVKNIAGVYILIDTIKGINNTSFNCTAYNPDSASCEFEVAAYDSCRTAGNYNLGTLSNPQQTIWLRETKDICARTNTLTWNKYINLVPGVKSYEVFASINGGPYTVIGTTNANETTFIDTTITFTQNKCYYIRVVDSTRKDTTASSNGVCCSFVTAFLPRYFYLNDATALNTTSNVMVQCYIDTTSGFKYYELIRAYNQGGPYSSVGTVNAPLHQSFVTYIDTANPNIQSYYYKVIGLDSCHKNVDTSNLGKTIYLTALGEPNSINHLTWNAYQDWLTGVSNYLVYRAEDNGPYSLVGTMPGGVAGEYIFDDNVLNIIMGYGVFSYYVRAVENPSLYPFVDTSVSNVAVAYQDPNVFIPDAFDPKGKNKVFQPVGKFVDVQGYDFTILDRWGDVLFESNDPAIGWNGMYKGKIVQEGVYVYLLTYTSNKGEYFQRKGTVTLLK